MNSGTRVKLLICLVSDFGSFDYLCSFDSRTLPQRRPSMTDTRFIPNRVRVNASIHKSGHGKYTFKRSAFVFPVPDKLCGWRHLLALGEGIMRVSAAAGRCPFPETPCSRRVRTEISIGNFIHNAKKPRLCRGFFIDFTSCFCAFF